MDFLSVIYLNVILTSYYLKKNGPKISVLEKKIIFQKPK